MLRDMHSKAIVSIDKPALESYKKRRKHNQEINVAMVEVQAITCDINNMKSELYDIKGLLMQILQQNKGIV